MVSVARLNFEKTGKPNRHAFHDVGLAMGSLLVEATALGLFVHQMAGFSVDKVREAYQVPEGFERWRRSRLDIQPNRSSAGNLSRTGNRSAKAKADQQLCV